MCVGSRRVTRDGGLQQPLLIVVTPDQVGSGCIFLLCGLSELKLILLCHSLSMLGKFGMWNLEVTLPEKRKKQFLSVIV